VIQFKLSSSPGNSVDSALAISDEGECSEASGRDFLVGGILPAKSLLLEGILMSAFQNATLTSWSLVAAEIQSSDVLTKMYNNGHIYL